MKSLTAIAERLLHFAVMHTPCAASPLLGSREAVAGQAAKLVYSQGCPSSTPHQEHPYKHPRPAPLGSQAGWAGLEQDRSLPGAKTDGLCPVFLLEKLLPVQLLLPECQGQPRARFAPSPQPALI